MLALVSTLTPRLDPKPWGGHRLASAGIRLPGEGGIGEALVTAGDAFIREGFGEKDTLHEAILTSGLGMIGDRGAGAVNHRHIFPLLIKLIDAAENLSIQVHPDDAGAEALDRLGKTEAWHILAAEPGSALYLGLRSGVTVEEFRAAAERADGSSASLLRRVPAEPGTTVLLPAGTVHALGAGVMVYEVQQPSDVTFRLDDWGRRDVEGNPREMHVEQGMAAIKPHLMPEVIAPIRLRSAIGQRHLLTACRYFALERITLHAGSRLELPIVDSPQVLTVLQGTAMLSDGDYTYSVERGASGVIWPASLTVEPSPLGTGSAPLVVLRAWVPDLAVDVIAPARASGAEDAAIAALAGPLDDVRRAVQPH